MRSLSSTVRQKLEALIEAGVVCWLLELEASDMEAFHLAANSSPVIFNGRSYRPFPFSVGELPDAGNGDLVTTTVTLSNVGRMAMQYLESGTYDQGDANLILVYINPDGSVTETGIRFDFTIQSASAKQDVISIELGQPNFYERPFPAERFLRSERFPAIPRNQ